MCEEGPGVWVDPNHGHLAYVRRGQGGWLCPGRPLSFSSEPGAEGTWRSAEPPHREGCPFGQAGLLGRAGGRLPVTRATRGATGGRLFLSHSPAPPPDSRHRLAAFWTGAGGGPSLAAACSWVRGRTHGQMCMWAACVWIWGPPPHPRLCPDRTQEGRRQDEWAGGDRVMSRAQRA